jgi:hypothetical protein
MPNINDLLHDHVTLARSKLWKSDHTKVCNYHYIPVNEMELLNRAFLLNKAN